MSNSADRSTLLRLADEYEAGTIKAVATGYAEFGPEWQHERVLIISALRTSAHTGDLAQSAPKPISMQDVRLVAGEGKLAAATVLDACNAIIRQRKVHSPDNCGRECQYYDYFEMLWSWFADESRNGSEDMRANIPDGLSADDFKNMLDEHESSIMADIALKQPDSHNGSSADRETVAKIIYDAFPFEPRHGMAHKPEWLPGGNSNRQDDARRAADLILALNEPQAAREPGRPSITDDEAFTLTCLIEHLRSVVDPDDAVGKERRAEAAFRYASKLATIVKRTSSVSHHPLSTPEN